MLAVLGPVFAGLNSLVLESVPQVEIRVIAAESTQPTPDVVVVERVVDRMVYVPVDNLSVAAPTRPADERHEPSTEHTGEAGIGETTDDTASDAVADKPDSEPVSVAPVAVRRVVNAPSLATVQPVPEDDGEAEAAEASEESDAVADEVQADEPVVAVAPRPIIVHTMVWNGEQFVQAAVTTVEVPAAPDAAEEADIDEDAVTQGAAEDEEVAEDTETGEALVKVAETEVADAHDEEVASGEDAARAVADESSDDAEEVATENDDPERTTADQQAKEPAQVMSADGPAESEQLADVVDEAEQAVTAEASDESEQVAVEGAADEPSDDDGTRARAQAVDAEATPAPTN